MPATIAIPKRVTLCAIGYHVAVKEGAVVFSAEPGVAGCYTRLAFERRCGCWYVTILDSDDSVMVAHILAAQRLIIEWFGGNHECPRGEHVP